MKYFKVALVCLIGAFPVIARAQDATTQPTNVPPPVDPRLGDRPHEFDGPFGRYNRQGYRGGRLDFFPSDAEFGEISAFMKEHSPERFKVINSLPEDQRRRMVILATRNYRNYKRVELDQPELAHLMLSRVELEDQAFKLVNLVKADKARGDTTALQADQQLLQDKIGDLVDTSIRERQVRIARLESTLQAEQQQLAEDSRNRDQLAKKRFQTLLGSQATDGDSTKPATQP